MRKKGCIIFISIFLLFSICLGKSFRKYDMSTGLSHNSVLCVTQTQDGYIWIGTRDGLNSFMELIIPFTNKTLMIKTVFPTIRSFAYAKPAMVIFG